ncbi:MAG: DUF99 family protein [Candidatus Micrarchaeota archaeon]|nr:DUF99 family protein [Candidatus Micrarchaeota archaeon]
MMVKNEIRIAGVDDGPFQGEKCLVIATIFRGGNFLDGLLSTEITVDGTDATEKIGRMIANSKFKDLRVIMLDGITVGGFNVVDIKELNRSTGLPVIAVSRRHPDFNRFLKGLENLDKKEQRIKAVENAGELYCTNNGKTKLWFQISGIGKTDAEKILKMTCVRSNIPEPLRVAHIIASGIIRGESVGRA